jgi:hypothetical protein
MATETTTTPIAEGREAGHGHCSLGFIGPGAGVCKDPACQRRSPYLVNGYCAGCAASRHVAPIRITTEAAGQ